jgi:type I restriction enzyme S subunit
MEQKYLLPEFYNLLLQSHTVSRNRMFANAQGQTRPGLNSTILRELPVPLCSLLEQTEIVERLDAKLDSLRKIEQEIEGELSRSTSLRQSILKKAFSGQLVPQDPEDEPASVLLERIEADKRAAELALQKKRKTKKAAVKRKNSTKKRSTRKTT